MLEFVSFLAFLLDTLTSQSSKKNSTGHTVMLWVCKTSAWIRGMQRTLNYGRTTYQSVFIWESVDPPTTPQLGPRFFVYL